MIKEAEKTKQTPGISIKTQLRFAGIFIAAVIVVFFVIDLITGGKFLDFERNMQNIKNILGVSMGYTFLVWAQCFMIACGYRDLSWGALMILVAYSMNIFGNRFGIFASVLAAVITGTVFLFLNFCIFAIVKIPAWIASLALAMLYESFGLYLYLGRETKSLVDVALDINLRTFGRLPWSLIIMLVGLVIVYFIYGRTTIGFNIRAIGGNQQVASALGISVRKTLLQMGFICGLLLGIGMFVQHSYNGFSMANSGFSSVALMFYPMAIAQLANTLSTRINVIVAAPVCAFLLFSVFNLLTLFGVQSGTLQEGVLALFLVTFAAIARRGYKGVSK